MWIVTEKNTGAGADAEGHIVDVHWDGAVDATIHVSKEGYAPGIVVAAVKDAVPGAIRVVELTRDASLASLVLRPIVPCGIDSDGYSVELAPLAPDPSRSNEPWVEKDFSLRDSEWRFDGVASGRYRIDVRAHPPSSGKTLWCVPGRIEVELKPGETTARELSFVTGGHLAITARDEHAVTTTTVLGGEERFFRFTYFDSHTGRTEQGGGSSITAPIGVRAELVEPLEPGPLTLTITRDTPDHAKRERTVNITPGQTTELVVDFSKPDER